MLDIGSGNGFPAIPILCFRPGLQAVLRERSERKGLFLDAVLRETGIEGVVIEASPIALQRGRREESLFHYVISRAALAPAQYLSQAAAQVLPGGRIFLYANASVGDLLAEEAPQSLELLAKEPIPDRRESFLYVLEHSKGRPAT